MDVLRHVQAIQHDLAAAAALGDDETAEAGRKLAGAVEATLQLRLLDVLTEASLVLNGQLRAGHVEVRLVGRDPDLVFVDEPDAPDEPPAPGDDLSARITLRLPEALKDAVEAAADREGISTNAWIVRALKREVDGGGRRGGGRVRGGNRLQGYARG